MQFGSAGVANSPFANIKQSSTHPKFLHSNSTSHVWAFSAIAELIDNASDPDVQATELHIDAELDGVPRLTFTDNGFGMVPQKLHKMLSFGYCEKVEINGHKPIGHYGNGFKSGSMRLGKDTLVFTKHTESMSCGFLSQTFLEATKSDCVLVPMLLMTEAEATENLTPIFTYSPFTSLEKLLPQFDKIKKTGTMIVIFNLRKDGNMLEFSFEEDKRDIRIRSDNQVAGTVGAAGRKFQRQRVNQDPTTDIPLDYSLRAYCEILYLRPRMLLYIRTFKVRTKMIAHSLTKTRIDTYKPTGSLTATKITYGLNGENMHVYGMMLYHRNRLIKPYVRVGIQLQNNKEGVGVIGVIEADFLQPTHNKQDFDYTPAYRRCIAKLSDLLETYWYDIKRNPQPTRKPAPVNGQTTTSQTTTTANNGNNGVVAIPKPPQSQIILLPFDSPIVAADPNKPDIIPYDAPSSVAPTSVVEEVLTAPDEIWVQCDNCLKWRKLPAQTKADTLPDKWYCYLNTSDPARADCAVPQQADDEPDDVVSLKTARKKQKEMERAALASKKAEEAKKLAAAQQEELRKKQMEEQRLRAMEEETNRLKAEQEKQRKIIEDQQRRELQYQEQVRAMREKEQMLKQREAIQKADDEKKRKEIENWLQTEEKNLKKRKTDDEPATPILEPKVEPSPISVQTSNFVPVSPSPSLSSSPSPSVSVPPSPSLSNSQNYVHIPSSPSAPSAPSPSPSAPPRPLSTAIKRLSNPSAPSSPSISSFPSSPSISSIPSSPSLSSTPVHIPSSPIHVSSPIQTSPIRITSSPPTPLTFVPSSLSSSSSSLSSSSSNLPPPSPKQQTSAAPIINGPSMEVYEKVCTQMATLVNALNIPGISATSDPTALAKLDVNRVVEEAVVAHKAKPQAELTNLRTWIRKLLILLARTKELNVEESELDTYFVEWVKRQESKRKGEMQK